MCPSPEPDQNTASFASLTTSLFWVAGWHPIRCPGWKAEHRIRFGKVIFLVVMMVAQVRPLHGSGCGQQQEVVGMELRPETFSIFRTQEKYPVKTFNEGCVMVKQPALELISHLKRADYSKPTLRYLLYGVKGSGKTMSLCHTVHYCSTQGWLVLHIPDAHLWVKNCKELLPSSYHASRFDQPIQASNWLRNFRTTNEHFLSKIKLRQRYVWTKRESTEEGRPLGVLVDMGVSCVKSSSDVVGAVLKELRLQAGGTEGGFRLAVAVGVNSLWGRTTLKKEDKSPVAPEELTLVHNLRKMINNDWDLSTLQALPTCPRSCWERRALTAWTLLFQYQSLSTVRRSLRAGTSTTWTATGYNTHTVRQRKGRKNSSSSATETLLYWRDCAFL
uniref:28S ribosomal protein S29, mitochondrial-like isoform X2 n=1 Tax=Oncorhynchus gorbuscha TaxID=8017 RepID=UPI001EAEA789|nr:28S ribosomal protein S29, mitochondrial-like isoform X2 [Oncorhynchus gorbuscha]